MLKKQNGPKSNIASVPKPKRVKTACCKAAGSQLTAICMSAQLRLTLYANVFFVLVASVNWPRGRSMAAGPCLVYNSIVYLFCNNVQSCRNCDSGDGRNKTMKARTWRKIPILRWCYYGYWKNCSTPTLPVLGAVHPRCLPIYTEVRACTVCSTVFRAHFSSAAGVAKEGPCKCKSGLPLMNPRLFMLSVPTW